MKSSSALGAHPVLLQIGPPPPADPAQRCSKKVRLAAALDDAAAGDVEVVGSISMPMPERPRRWQATSVVPLPIEVEDDLSVGQSRGTPSTLLAFAWVLFPVMSALARG